MHIRRCGVIFCSRKIALPLLAAKTSNLNAQTSPKTLFTRDHYCIFHSGICAARHPVSEDEETSFVIYVDWVILLPGLDVTRSKLTVIIQLLAASQRNNLDILWGGRDSFISTCVQNLFVSVTQTSNSSLSYAHTNNSSAESSWHQRVQLVQACKIKPGLSATTHSLV